MEERLLAALDKLERAQAAASDSDVLQARLAAALAAQKAAEDAAADQLSAAEARARLLAEAQDALSQEQAVSAEAQRQTALLNQQVAALRSQLGSLQALLDDYKARDVASQVQLQTLGQDLNAALARAASEERKRRILEEAERKRLEAEAEALRQKQRRWRRKKRIWNNTGQSSLAGCARCWAGRKGCASRGTVCVLLRSAVAPGSAELSSRDSRDRQNRRNPAQCGARYS